MERYRNFVRIEQMKENIRAGRIESALQLADEINPAKVKNNSDLSIMADLYLENGKLKHGSDCLMELYSRKKTRSILMQLVNLSVRIKKVEAAEKFAHEFKEMAPNDFYNYIFRYNIDKLKGKSLEVLIADLEKLKEVEYIESWAYELAKLYHKAGEKHKCIEECNDIEIWFGDGEYVERAQALKAYYTTGMLNVEREEEALRAADEAYDEEATVAEESAASDDESPDSYETGRKQPVGADDVIEITAPEEPECENDDDMKVSESAQNEEDDLEEIEITPDESEDSYEEQIAEEGSPAEEENSAEEENPVEEVVQEELPDEEPEVSESSETEHETDDFSETEERSVEEREITRVTPEVMPATIEATEQLESGTDEALIMKMLAEEESALANAVSLVTEDDLPKKDESAGVDFGVMQLVEHEYKGVKDAPVAADSLLAKFLAQNDSKFEEYFGYFAYQADVRQQLIKVLEILLNPQIKNKCVTITGDYNNGIRSIIRGITKILYQNGFLTGKQVACVDCEKFNTMKINEKDERLVGCCLTIKNAGRITASAVDKLMKVNESLAGKTAVVLTDDRSDINRLFRDNRELNSMFPQRVHLPSFDLEDLIDMLFVHLNENDLSICQEAYDEAVKELKVILKINKDSGVRVADIYSRAIVDVVETRKAKKLIDANFAFRSDEHENVVTVDDIRNAKQAGKLH